MLPDRTIWRQLCEPFWPSRLALIIEAPLPSSNVRGIGVVHSSGALPSIQDPKGRILRAPQVVDIDRVDQSRFRGVELHAITFVPHKLVLDSLEVTPIP